MKHFLLITIVVLISEKVFFFFFYGKHFQTKTFLLQCCAAYQSKLFLEKWGQTDKEYSRKVIIKVYPLPHC